MRGSVRVVLWFTLAVLLGCEALAVVSLWRLSPVSRGQQSRFRQSVLEQSQTLNRVAFAGARFFEAGDNGGDGEEDLGAALLNQAAGADQAIRPGLDDLPAGDPLLILDRLAANEAQYRRSLQAASLGHSALQFADPADRASAREGFAAEVRALLSAAAARSHLLAELESMYFSRLRESSRGGWSMLSAAVAGLALATLAASAAVAWVLRTHVREIRLLRGLIPICSHCKKVRDEHGVWKPVEVYVRSRSGAEFTHGLCPDCLHELYPGHEDHPPEGGGRT